METGDLRKLYKLGPLELFLGLILVVPIVGTLSNFHSSTQYLQVRKSKEMKKSLFYVNRFFVDKKPVFVLANNS